jgi:putative heme iron utilization protein
MKPEAEDLPARARELLMSTGKAALGTLAMREGSPVPFVSLVEAAPAVGANLVLLLSDLSDHARHLVADPHASLLIDATEGLAQPLAGARLTVMGEVARSQDPVADRTLFLGRFPHAALYADFGDFRFYRFAIREGYFVAGFGRVARLRAEDLV